MDRSKLDAVCERVIKRLRGKVVIHRYDSFSTNSIYLKFDYGVANSLRISDHNGKYHLRYRYNILTEFDKMPCKITQNRDGLAMVFYGTHMVNACCEDILKEKRDRQERYRDYDSLVEEAKVKAAQPQKGFWSGARFVAGGKK